MKRLTVLCIVAFLGLILFPTAVLAGQWKKSAPVRIVKPLPLPVTGTVDANVTGSVEVTNLPAESGLTRLQEYVSGSYTPDDSYWTAEYGPVAAGETLVVEFVTIYSLLGTDAESAPACKLYVLTEPGCRGALADKLAMLYNMPMTPSRDYRGNLELTSVSEVLIFVEEGQNLCVRCDLPDDQDITCLGCGQLSFSGHIDTADPQ